MYSGMPGASGVVYKNVVVTDDSNSSGDGQSQIGPYPPSSVITNIEWAPPNTVVRDAHGSDNFPMTWADDDDLYTTWGDGNGFNGSSRRSLGYAKISGPATNFTGTDIPSAGEQTGDGPSGKKASGMLMVEGTLYMWVRNADLNGKQCQLAWSSDHAKNWTWSDWKFAEFGFCTFLNYGKNYEGARDNYVYMYSSNGPSAYKNYDNFILTRVLKGSITDRNAYEFFVGLDGANSPIWTGDIAQRGPVFTHPGRSRRSGISYNAALGRYLWWQLKMPDDQNYTARFDGGFGVFDAPEPWGPWTTAFYVDARQRDMGSGEAGNFPTKWMSQDGLTVYLVSSGDDAFSVRKATLTVAVQDDTPPSIPTGLSAAALSQSQISLSWNAADDPDSGISGYKVYRDGDEIATTAGLSFDDAGLEELTEYSYQVSAQNGAFTEGLPSESIFVTTLADVTPPSIVNVSASGDQTKVKVVFSEPVDQTSAEAASSYTIDNGISVSGATLETDLKTVTMVTSALSEEVAYTLTVIGVRDRASTPNTIANNSTATFTYVTQLVISNLSPLSYQVGELATGAKVYVDRVYEFTTIPDFVTGSAYIKTANDDKQASGNPFVSFDVNQEVTVYVAHDDRISPKPAWMQSFADTGVNIEIADMAHSLYGKTFPQGTVELGGNEGDSSSSMYSVLVTNSELLSLPSIVTITVQSGEVGIGESVSIPIVMDSVLDGVSGFVLTATLSNPAVAENSEAVLPGGFNLESVNQTSSGQITVAAVDGGNGIGPGDSNVTLLTLVITGLAEGDTGIDVLVERLDDDSGFDIERNVQQGTLKVTEDTTVVDFPTLPGMDATVQDIDGDGKAEDINGNGRLDFADLVALFEHLNSAEVQGNPQYFDFNGNGVVDMADVLELFNTLIALSSA